MKLNESFSGEGNAIFRYPDEPGDRLAIRKALRSVEFAVPWETHQNYFQKFTRMGGIVEEFIDAAIKISPSAQLRTSPAGEVLPTSTHDQILGGPSGQVYQGCSFPDHPGVIRPRTRPPTIWKVMPVRSSSLSERESRSTDWRRPVIDSK